MVVEEETGNEVSRELQRAATEEWAPHQLGLAELGRMDVAAPQRHPHCSKEHCSEEHGECRHLREPLSPSAAHIT